MAATVEKKSLNEQVQSKTGTTYLVFRSVEADELHEAPHAEAWVALGSAVALTDTQAISKVIAEHSIEAGTFVAIPARSFRPRTVEVHTRRSLRIQ